ncbi:MAG: hypothetical protein RMK91_12010 [Pseudanabaenaceae cyanobacterium SKYGB_i_bin29]|nr:hypothetical protein [Pseudanabaenaceae cyanobacterium SKYG29]MDW8422579.1 hypothetical protein [Pseudanabaenaceae cyanobacterium SKYGB_i_bin29]
MSNHYPSDYNIAEELNLLVDKVHQMMDSAQRMIAEAKSFETVRELLTQMHQCQSQMQEFKNFYADVTRELGKFQEMIEYLQRLDISEELLDRLNDILQRTLFHSQQAIESEKKLKEFNQSFDYTKQSLNALQEQYQLWYQGFQEKQSQLAASISSIREQVYHFNQMADKLAQDIGQVNDLAGTIANVQDRVSNCLLQLSMLDSVESLLVDARALKLSIDSAFSGLVNGIEQAELIREELENKKLAILQISDEVVSNVKRVQQEVVSILQDLRQIAEELGGKATITDIKNLLEEARQTRALLHEARANLVGVRSLEEYIKDFQDYRHRPSLRQYLQKELGWLGTLLYFLHLLTKKR